MIWFKSLDLNEINGFNRNTLVEHLDIIITKLSDDSMSGTMPIDSKTVQPFRILHGGASCVLAETLGSIASNCCIDNSKFVAVGQSINANHISSARSGRVTGICKPIHIGRSSHVWEINIYDESEKLICVSRLTMAVIMKRD